MTTQPPFDPNAFDPAAYRAETVPSDTQAIYLQEGGKEKGGILFHSPTKHPKLVRLQEIMLVSALLCFVHGLISAFAPGNLKPLEGLPEFGVAGGLGLLVVSAIIYAWVYVKIQGGFKLGLTVGLIFAILGAFVAIMSMIGNSIDAQRYGFVPLYAAWFIANVLWIRASFDPAVKDSLK